MKKAIKIKGIIYDSAEKSLQFVGIILYSLVEARG